MLNKRKKSHVLLTAGLFVVLMILSGCSDDKNPAGSQTTYPLIITVHSNSSEIDLNDFATHIIEGTKAVLLSDLVDTSLVAFPRNYAYRLVGEDGFYAHSKGNPDNIWDHLLAGHLLLPSMNTTFDTSLGLPGRYNIKDTAEMKIIRKIDVITPADSLMQFIVDEMTHTAFEDTLTSIALVEFIPSEIVSNLSVYMYDLVAADDFTKTLSYEQLLKGYYIIENDRVLYSDPEIPSGLKIRNLNRLIIFNPLDK